MFSIYNTIKNFSKNFQDEVKEELPLSSFESDIDFEFLKNFHDNAPICSLVYNTLTMTYDYFSDNIEQMMGYTSTDFKTGGLKFAMTLVHPDHAKIYSRELLPIMIKYISMYAFSNRIKDLRFTYNFKIRTKDGNYIWAMHNMSIFKVTKVHIPTQFITYITDFSAVKQDESITLCVSEKTQQYNKPVFTKIFHPNNETLRLTKRELDILHKIAGGKTSDQIANELSLSIHTINTHRKNMLVKTGSNNITQLIQLYRNVNIGIK